MLESGMCVVWASDCLGFSQRLKHLMLHANSQEHAQHQHNSSDKDNIVHEKLRVKAKASHGNRLGMLVSLKLTLTWSHHL